MSHFRNDGARSIAPRRAMLGAPEITFGNQSNMEKRRLKLALRLVGDVPQFADALAGSRFQKVYSL